MFRSVLTDALPVFGSRVPARDQNNRIFPLNLQSVTLYRRMHSCRLRDGTMEAILSHLFSSD